MDRSSRRDSKKALGVKNWTDKSGENINKRPRPHLGLLCHGVVVLVVVIVLVAALVVEVVVVVMVAVGQPIGPINCPETSLFDYQSKPRNNPEERRFYLHSGESL
jgi:hypothetical protein